MAAAASGHWSIGTLLAKPNDNSSLKFLKSSSTAGISCQELSRRLISANLRPNRIFNPKSPLQLVSVPEKPVDSRNQTWKKPTPGPAGSTEEFTVKRLKSARVRPASETYKGVYFLSNLDQVLPFIVRVIHCYENDERLDGRDPNHAMKQALAQVLVKYYPLAGKLEEDSDGRLFVNCTGEGVPFVEAVSENNLEDLGDITAPDPLKLGKLIHTIPGATTILETPLLTVQVTKFRCGGVVLGAALNHCIADGPSMMDFVRTWAKAARGLPLTSSPVLDRTVLGARRPLKIDSPHPQFEEIEDTPNISRLFSDYAMQYQSFHFDPEKLNKLRKMAMEEGFAETCTDFTLPSAFVWRTRCKALVTEPDQEVKLLMAVNGRPKLRRQLPKQFFGNAVLVVPAKCKAGYLMGMPFSYAVNTVQQALKAVTEGYIRSSIDYIEETRRHYCFGSSFLISSWTGMHFNNVMDFGWGRPVQTGPADLPPVVALFLRRGTGKEGITVSLCLPAPAMLIFQDLMQI